MNSIKYTAGFDIDQPAADLFPLFSPEGEKLWVPGWDYENSEKSCLRLAYAGSLSDGIGMTESGIAECAVVGQPLNAWG